MELQENFRQKDTSFVQVLNKIRKGVQEDRDIGVVNGGGRGGAEERELAVALYPVNSLAERENLEKLGKIKVCS